MIDVFKKLEIIFLSITIGCLIEYGYYGCATSIICTYLFIFIKSIADILINFYNTMLCKMNLDIEQLMKKQKTIRHEK